MAAEPSQVFFPPTFAELFAAWSRFPGAVPFAGGTGIACGQGGLPLGLPPVLICLDRLDETRRITRTERYLEIGAAVPLSRLARLGKIVPPLLSACLSAIGGAQVRSLATVGGNVCFASRRLDAATALSALEAQYELRTALAARWVSASRFSAVPVAQALSPQELLARIRIPLDHWDFSAYRKFGEQGVAGDALAFLAKAEKGVLTGIRVAYKTDTVLRDKEGETHLSGEPLPLSRHAASEFVQRWEAALAASPGAGGASAPAALNYIEACLYHLSR